jgi:glycosyltransferase involved in cell wall biosynthesis
MSLGCTVIASNSGSIPEICDQAAIYFNPHDLENLKDTLEETLGNATLKSKKIDLGFQRSKLFNWEETAKQTAKIYTNVLK